MPSFDRSSSRLSRKEAELLRGVLGPARPRDTTLRAASSAYHRSQRRSMFGRAATVLILLAAFMGSASLMSQRQPATTPAVATRTFIDPLTTGSIGPARAAPLSLSGPNEEAAKNRP